MFAAYRLMLWGDAGPFDGIVLSPLVTALLLLGAAYGLLRLAHDLVQMILWVVRRPPQ